MDSSSFEGPFKFESKEKNFEEEKGKEPVKLQKRAQSA